MVLDAGDRSGHLPTHSLRARLQHPSRDLQLSPQRGQHRLRQTSAHPTDRSWTMGSVLRYCGEQPARHGPRHIRLGDDPTSSWPSMTGSRRTWCLIMVRRIFSAEVLHLPGRRDQGVALAGALDVAGHHLACCGHLHPSVRAEELRLLLPAPAAAADGRKMQRSLTLAQAVEAADDGAVGLLSVADDLATTVGALRCKAVDRGLETVEGRLAAVHVGNRGRPCVVVTPTAHSHECLPF